MTQAGVELLDRKMATLRADISEKAAEAAKVYKFNAGAAHPTADSSPETVAAGTRRIVSRLLAMCCRNSRRRRVAPRIAFVGNVLLRRSWNMHVQPCAGVRVRMGRLTELA